MLPCGCELRLQERQGSGEITTEWKALADAATEIAGLRRYAFVVMTLLRAVRSHLVALSPGPLLRKALDGSQAGLLCALLEQQIIELRLDLRNALKLQLKLPQRVGER